MKRWFVANLIMTCGSLLWADAKIPALYVDKGVCPGECCRYGEWTATKPTLLVDQPEGKKAAGKVAAGEKVRALTGEVHVHPTSIQAAAEDPSYGIHKGDPLIVMTYLGEGSWKVLLKDGRVIELPLETMDKSRSPQEWWIQIETKKDGTGWTKQSDHFEMPGDCR